MFTLASSGACMDTNPAISYAHIRVCFGPVPIRIQACMSKTVTKCSQI